MVSNVWCTPHHIELGPSVRYWPHVMMRRHPVLQLIRDCSFRPWSQSLDVLPSTMLEKPRSPNAAHSMMKWSPIPFGQRTSHFSTQSRSCKGILRIPKKSCTRLANLVPYQDETFTFSLPKQGMSTPYLVTNLRRATDPNIASILYAA